VSSRRPGRRFTGERGYGIVGDIVIGIVGAFLGGFLASLIGLGANGLVGTIIIAFIGACILIAVLRFFSRRSLRRHRRRLSSTVFLHIHESLGSLLRCPIFFVFLFVDVAGSADPREPTMAFPPGIEHNRRVACSQSRGQHN
jgi:uncharacterized membrane protein YeaQ/YmgE (transglycosylase-associated protein family)